MMARISINKISAQYFGEDFRSVDFSWSEEELAFAEGAREFAHKHLNTDLKDRLENQRFCRDSWNACGDYGLLGLSASPEYGGLGFGPLRTAKIIENILLQKNS